MWIFRDPLERSAIHVRPRHPAVVKEESMQQKLAPWALFALASVFSSIACGSSSSGGATGPQSIFNVPASLDDLTDVTYYDVPWPNDLRKDPDGTIHIAGMYDPSQNTILETYETAAKGLFNGFSTTADGYFRFTDPIDESTLPANPQATLDPSASVQLIDIDPASPTKGQRHLVQTFWRADDGIYWLHNTLTIGPALGYPLSPKTKYAIVVTKSLKTAAGATFSPSGDLSQILGLSALSDRVKAAHDAMAPDVAAVVAAGIPANQIVHFTSFTTNDPTAELFSIADNFASQVPAPTVEAGTWTQASSTGDYDAYQGRYSPSPNYQAGTPPYSQPSDGGNFVFDASGKPVLQNTFDMQFTLVVPNATKCPMPAAGYPIVLYAHGTGGDYTSIISEGNSVGQSTAQQCLASIGVNQPFSGDRPGAPAANDPNLEGDEDLLFFNLNNPAAARSNGRQGAVDVMQEARLFTETKMTVPAATSKTGAVISFDSSKIIFFGHSEGGVNGPLFLASSNAARGGVLSGTGAMIVVALLEKTEPQPSVAAAVKTLLGLYHPEDADELNLFHPVINLAQTIVDATDPVNYMPRIIQTPRTGFASKSIYQTEGVLSDGTGDSYAPPHGIEIASVALGLPVETPVVHPIAEAAFSGLGSVTVPASGLSGNLAGGAASGVLGQFNPAPNDDGHFVVFDVPACRLQAATFCKNLAADPKGNVPPIQ
jgi:hypothetical protein